MYCTFVFTLSLDRTSCSINSRVSDQLRHRDARAMSLYNGSSLHTNGVCFLWLGRLCLVYYWYFPLIKIEFRDTWESEKNLKNFTWWRHQMKAFSALLALCAQYSPVTGEFPPQRPVTWSFDVFLSVPEQTASKQSRRWWLETPSRSLWRHCNEYWSP